MDWLVSDALTRGVVGDCGAIGGYSPPSRCPDSSVRLIYMIPQEPD